MTQNNVADQSMIAFGPVPSRRLGRSLGVNNIPPKVCSYACIYCQVGRTITMQVERQPFYEPEQIAFAVREKVEKSKDAGEPIDYLTFVPDGEPTLDIHLGDTIQLLRPLGIKIAVITNASLIWRPDVRADLMLADWVSLKIDATWEAVWRTIDRPHGKLQLASILDGARTFSHSFQGDLVTETMLVRGINDEAYHLGSVADFLAVLRPTTAYLAIPTRPPAEPWVQATDADTVNRAYQIFDERIDKVEYLIGYEGNAFAFTGNIEEDLLSIMAVHPMREDAVHEFLHRADAEWAVVQKMINQHQLVTTDYQQKRFYLRNLKRREKMDKICAA